MSDDPRSEDPQNDDPRNAMTATAGAPRARDYRDTDVVAVWGFVLALFVPFVGLAVSWVALRRVRRTGDGGWGLALAGTIISGIVTSVGVVAGLVLFVQANQPAWARAGDLRVVAAVTGDLGTGIGAYHEDNGRWPSSLDQVGSVDGDAANGVHVTAYREGDRVCVEGYRNSVVGSWSQGSFTDEACDRAVFGTLLGVAWGNEQLAAQREAAGEAADVVQARADDAAAASSLGEPKDLGLLHVPDIDLMACALVAGNRGLIENDEQWQALTDAFGERAATVDDGGLENEAYWFEEPPAGGDEGRAEAMLRADFACWYGGYVGPGPEPVFPTAWTTPLTQEMVDAEDERLASWDSMTEAERAPYIAKMDADYAQERAEIEAIIAERY